MSNEVPGLDWSGERMLPAFQAPQHLDIYDLRAASGDVQLAVTTMTGIVNRPQPRIYLITNDDDLFWLNQIPASASRSTSPATGDGVLTALLLAHRASIQGLIIYDPGLIDTVNVATMLAAQRDAMVVSPDLAQNLHEVYQLPILADLRSYGWRSRMQAYHWAQQNLLEGCSARLLAGLDPGIMGSLRSFLVATRTFIYWLDSRKYLPAPSDGWLSERGLMQQIIGAYAPGTVHLGWFIDEPSGVGLTSQAALPVLATDHCTNLEVLAAALPQSPRLISQVQQADSASVASDKIYVSFTISDGDNLQYCQHRMLHLWQDSARGTLPIGWTISPALLQVTPMLAEYYMRTLTPNDELIAGPSGASYMFPTRWPGERLMPFLQQTGSLMQAMDIETLEVLDIGQWQSSGLPLSNINLTGMAFDNEQHQQAYIQALASCGLRGILSGSGQAIARWKMVNGVPVYQNLGLAGSVNGALSLIKNAVLLHPQRPHFLNVYILAWSMAPSDLKQIAAQLGAGYEIVLPRRLLALLATTC
jgi:hypothetical protein